MVEKLSEMGKDFLKEMASIATGNASTILSEKVGQEIKLTAPVCKLVSPIEAEKHVMVSKGIAVCTFAKVRGRSLGSAMLVFDNESAFRMADLLQNRKLGTTDWLSEGDQKKLLKMGNTVFECYLEAMRHFMDTDLQLEDLKLFSTIGDAVVDLILGRNIEGFILAIKNGFVMQEPVKAHAWFLLFLGAKDVISLIRKAGLE